MALRLGVEVFEQQYEDGVQLEKRGVGTAGTCGVRRLARRRTDGLAERGNRGTVARWEPGGALPPVTRQSAQHTWSVAPIGYLGWYFGYLLKYLRYLSWPVSSQNQNPEAEAPVTRQRVHSERGRVQPGEEAEESDNGTSDAQMTIKMETMSELPDIKAEVLPDEFGLNGGHNVTSAEASVPSSNGPDPNCQWVSSTTDFSDIARSFFSFHELLSCPRLYGVRTRRPYNGLLTDCLHCSRASSQNNLTPP